MAETNEILTPEKFHEILHKDINKPVLDFRKKRSRYRNRHIKIHTGAHKASWAKATIFFGRKVINVLVYLNFKQNGISDADYEKLKYLARNGITRYWSRRINVGGDIFMVRVEADHRFVNAIPVDLYVETDKNHYARSMNPSILGVDARYPL